MDFSQEYYKNMFVVKFSELERCHRCLTNYSLIQASNPIRSLLTDALPIVDVLNREKRLPIFYELNGKEWGDNCETCTSVMLWKELSPVFSDEMLKLKKDAFLKEPCIRYFDQQITIGDVLKFYAYVRGGIHLDNGDKKFNHLREAFEMIRINQVSILDHTMRGIVQVIYNTLSEKKELLLV